MQALRPGEAWAKITEGGSLPCTPATVVVNGVSYYQCGATWYNQAYSGDSVTYVTVTPPPGY